MENNNGLYKVKVEEEQFNKIKEEIKEAERFYLSLNDPVDEDGWVDEMWKYKNAYHFIAKHKDEVNKMAYLRICILKNEYLTMYWENGGWTDKKEKEHYQTNESVIKELRKVESYL